MKIYKNHDKKEKKQKQNNNNSVLQAGRRCISLTYWLTWKYMHTKIYKPMNTFATGFNVSYFCLLCLFPLFSSPLLFPLPIPKPIANITQWN